MERLAVVRRRIEAAGGDPGRVEVLAVTKGFGPEAVTLAAAAGLPDVGENYAQELLAKAAASTDQPVRWHFIGRLQRNKVRKLGPLVHLWQSVDRAELGSEIARHAPGAAVLVQVDVSGDPGKGGCPPAEVARVAASLTERGLDVQGLMVVGPAGEPESARAGFRRVTDLADSLDLPVRSMGMTHDLEVAVQEGSTMVRVGTALFGPRPARGG